MISIPFSGSKRHALKQVKAIVEAGGYRRVFEPFGGSAVLSVNLYNDGLIDQAYINDYDGLFDIYPEYLDIKDWLVEKCFSAGLLRITGWGGHYSLRDRDDNVVKDGVKSRPLSQSDRKVLQGYVKRIPERYWRLLSMGHNFCHAAVPTHKEIKLSDFAYFARDLKTEKQREYLKIIKELNRDSLDYKEFLRKYSFKDGDLIIVDPPYTDTAQEQYKKSFTEDETIRLLKDLKALRVDFIFFNHDAERVKDWLGRAGITDYQISLTGCKTSTVNGKRLDVMTYVKPDRSETGRKKVSKP